jgi:hypothetical protein
MRDVLGLARAAAVAVALGTTAFLLLGDNWHADNPFLVPDLALAAVLLVGAALPRRWAAPTLVAGFGLTAGVLGVSVSTYAVDGRIGAASALGVVTAIAMAALLLRPAPLTASR